MGDPVALYLGDAALKRHVLEVRKRFGQGEAAVQQASVLAPDQPGDFVAVPCFVQDDGEN